MKRAGKKFSLVVPTNMEEIPEHWEWRTLQDVCAGVFDCPHTTPPLSDDGPLLARSQDIRSGYFKTEQAARVTEEVYGERIARAEPTFGDILFSREGTYFGIAAEVPKGNRLCLGQRMVLIRPSSLLMNTRYLRYWLNSPVLEIHMRGLHDGSVAQRLNLSTIRELPILVPPLEEQKSIASILGSLDDKIELNRQMNRTLEEMAAALFKSWFVDFDPVHAKAAGRRPFGMDDETAALFPDRFVESELGLIPEGWKSISLIDILACLTDGAHHSPPSVAVGFPMASVKDMTPWGMEVGSCRKISKEDFESLVSGGCQPEVGDVLLSKDGAKCLETVCEYRQIDKIVLLSSVAILRPKHKEASGFIHIWLSLPSTKTYLKEGFVSGSAIPRIVLKDLKKAKLVFPEIQILSAFNYQVANFRDSIYSNISESRNLSQLRDVLLPQLLSGKMRLKQT